MRRLLSRKAVLVPTRVFSDVPGSHPPAEPSLSVGSTTTHIGVLFDTHKFVQDLEKSGNYRAVVRVCSEHDHVALPACCYG